VTLIIDAVTGVGEIVAGDDLATVLLTALERSGSELRDGDVLTVTSKVVSKAEGRVVAIDDGEEAKAALIEAEAVRVIRRRGPLRITETRHGFICANAGIDLSNTASGTAVLLPVDPDRSARRLRGDLRRRAGVEVGVIITDTFGRAWRNGVSDVAIGCAGVRAVLDLRGTPDATGRILEATEVAVADEIASAANLVLAKAASTPFAIVRGLDASFFGEGSVGDDLVRRADQDLFR
jgi:coenzyme F420-0:L-glutamate ligase/coenzyme F420-1:gamma-L-glutamate ligase